jgi:ribonuclease HI
VLHYLDDIILLHPDPEYLKAATAQVAVFLQWLGWVISVEKSELTPKQQFLFLGWKFGSQAMNVCLPRLKRHSVLSTISQMEHAAATGTLVSARQLARWIGKLNSTRFQHRSASLALRSLDAAKTKAVKTGGWNGLLRLDDEAILAEIRWWKRTVTENKPRLIATVPPQGELYTDASRTGWGAWLKLWNIPQPLLMHGTWASKTTATSNARECRAVERALRRLQHLPEGRGINSLVVKSDNTATVYNINRQASCEALSPCLQALLRFAGKAGIELVAEHVPGRENNLADTLSRLSAGGEYQLRPELLQSCLRDWNLQIDVDLFAEKWNAQHRTFYSLRPDRLAAGRNAFHANWRQFSLPLLHPPIALLPKVLRQVAATRIRAILIAPRWTAQPWSAVLSQLTLRQKVLGSCEQALVPGRRMVNAGLMLPPGSISAFLLGEKTTTGNE